MPDAVFTEVPTEAGTAGGSQEGAQGAQTQADPKSQVQADTTQDQTNPVSDAGASAGSDNRGATASASEILAEAERKLTEDPSYQLTQEELNAFEEVRDADKPKKGAKAKSTSTVPDPKAGAEGDATKTVNPHNNPKISKAMEAVGAKTLDELPEKIGGLQKELDRLNGERAKLGKLNTLEQNLQGQHRLIADLLAGKREAIEFAAKMHGMDPSKIAAHSAPSGQAQGGKFDAFLDPDAAKYFDDQLKELGAIKEFFNNEQHRRAVSDARSETLNEISEVMAMAPEIYDAKKYGPLRAQMENFWNTKKDDPIPEGVKRVIEVLQIAAEHGFEKIKPAYEIWAYRNRGTLQTEAAKAATQAFTGKKPTVGLSDQQAGKNGQKGYTTASVEKMATGQEAIPEEWIHPRTGRLMLDKMPPELRNALVAGGKQQ
jgi:uncharacterized small protein (DUF1192 family)